MGDTRFRLGLLLAAFALSGCASGDPRGATSVYLTVENARTLAVPEELRVTAYGDNGAIFKDQRLPETGPLLPASATVSVLGTVTLYPGAGVTELRIDVRGYVGNLAKSEGSTYVSITRDRQVAARVVLQPALGDGLDASVEAGRDAGNAETSADGGVKPPDGRAADATLGGDGADATTDGGDAPAPDAGVGDAPGCQGSRLVGLVEIPSNPVDLTAERVLDWRHWGLGGAVDFKRSGGAAISDYSLIGNGSITTRFRNQVTYSWSDGSPTMSGTAVAEGMSVSGVGNGVSLTVPADVDAQTLAVYVAGSNDTGLFAATLSDGCAPEYSASSSNGRQNYDAVYRITFKSAVPGTELRVSWTMSAGFEDIALLAATLR